MSLYFEHTLCPAEKKRCRHCRGCIYFDVVAHYGCCNYFLVTGTRRPSRAGDRNCCVRKYPPGFVMPEWHKQYCKRIDDEEDQKQRDRDRAADQAEKTESDPDAPPKKTRGRRPQWDCEYGFRLYLDGYYYFEICEILGVKFEALAAYASDHFWKNKFPPGTVRHRHDIDAAKREYQAYLSQKEQAVQTGASA